MYTHRITANSPLVCTWPFTYKDKHYEKGMIISNEQFFTLPLVYHAHFRRDSNDEEANTFKEKDHG